MNYSMEKEIDSILEVKNGYHQKLIVSDQYKEK